MDRRRAERVHQRLGRFDESAVAFSVCIGQAHRNGDCFVQRARALGALGRNKQARADLDRAQELQPGLAEIVAEVRQNLRPE